MAQFNYNILVTGDCQNNSSGSISLLPYGGTAPYTVEWLTPNLGVDTVTILPSIRTGLLSNTYSLRLNDSTLPVNNEFYINIPISNGVCSIISDVKNTTCGENNGIITGSSTSQYSSTNFYLYSGSGEYITSAITNTNSIIFNNLTAGTYNMLAQDLGGCTGMSQTVVIEDSNVFDYGFYIVPNSSCGGQPIGKIYVTGETGVYPYTYFWSNNETTSYITGLTASVYEVTVTDSNGCVLRKSATVPNVDPVGFGNFVVQQPTCFQNNGEVIMTITGGTAPYYYSASTGYFEISYSQSFTVTGLTAGAISIKVTDAGFCNFTETVQLLTPNGISSASINTTNSSCSQNNGAINVSVQGGSLPYTYTLIYPTSDTSSVTTSNTTNSFINLTGGTYTVYVEDSSGCVYTGSAVIIAEDKFTISTSVTGSTCGINNAAIKVTASVGGTLPYDYILDGTNQILDTTQSAVTFTNVSQGLHSVSVVDADGCTQTKQVYVNYSQPIVYSLYSTNCGTGSDGAITAFISSGVPPFTFYWSNNVPNNPQSIIASGLTAGTYSVTIVDSTGCSLKRTTDLTCSESFISYQLYVMGEEPFQLKSGTKCGLLQMLNEGFVDLSNGHQGCVLNSAIFTAKVMVEPLGSVYTSAFFTTTSLTQAPSDNLWYNTIKTLLLSISGVQNVLIDALNNQITIQTYVGGPLNNQIITVDVLINYDITCSQ